MTATPSVTSGRPQQRVPLVEELRRENAQLREQRAKLAALADHYYCAYREAKSLVERRERELSDVRRQLESKPASVRR